MVQAYKFFGNVRDAAKNLGLTPSTFVRKRKQYQQKIQTLKGCEQYDNSGRNP